MKIKPSHLYWQIPVIFIGVASFLYLLFSMLPEYTILRNVFPTKEKNTISEETETETETETSNNVEEENEEEQAEDTEGIEKYESFQQYLVKESNSIANIYYDLILDTKKKEFNLEIEIFANLTEEKLSFSGSYDIDEEENIMSLSLPVNLWKSEYKIIGDENKRLEVLISEPNRDYPVGPYASFLEDILPKSGLTFISRQRNEVESCDKEFPEDGIPYDAAYDQGYFNTKQIKDESSDVMCYRGGTVILVVKNQTFVFMYNLDCKSCTSYFYGTYNIVNNKVVVSYDKKKYGNLGNIQFDIVKFTEPFGNMEVSYLRYSGDTVPSIDLSKGDIFPTMRPD